MKKHGFRSIFSLLLALMMVCSMLPTAAFAEGDTEEQSVVVEPVGTPAEEPKQDEVKPPEGGTPEEPKPPEGETPEEPKQPEGETSQGPAKPADAAPSDAGVPGSNRLTVSPMPNPDPTPATLNTGHKIDVTFTVLYVGDEFKIGYNYGSSERTKFVCQYSQPHSDTAATNHTIAISDIKAAADRASVNSGYRIVGWSKESNANPTTWGFDLSDPTACNKGTTIYLVAKNPNPTPAKPAKPSNAEVKDLLQNVVKVDCINTAVNHADMTYPLLDNSFTVSDVQGSASPYTCTVTVNAPAYVTRYDGDVGGTHTLSDDASKTITLKHDGRGWAAQTTTPIVFKVGCDAQPEPPKPDKPTAPGEGDLSGLIDNITVSCTNEAATHDSNSKSYALISGSYTPGEVEGDAENGYTYTVTINSQKYVEQFDTDTGAAHDPKGVTATVTLRHTDNGWTVTGGTPVVFNVACVTEIVPPTRPGAEDLAKLEAPVEVVCDTKPETHTAASFALIEGTYDIGEVVSNETDGYTCDITVTADKYVARYNMDYGKHTLTGDNTKTLTLKYVEGRWAVDTPITFPVECETAPEKPTPPTDEIGGATVAVKCITGHGDLSWKIGSSTFTVGEVTGDDTTGYTCTVTVQAEVYVNAFNSDKKANGVKHTLADDAEKTFTMTYVNGAWTGPTNPAVTFEVKCETQPEVPGDITDADLAKLKVVIHCTTNGSHTDRTYDLIAGTYRTDYSNDGGFTCYIAVLADQYVNKYISDTGTNHELVDPQKSSKTITLRWNTETKAWAADSNSVTFDVKCTTQEVPPAPNAEQVASLLKVKVNCANSSAAHQKDVPAFVYQPLLAGSFDIGEVTGSAESGYACRITVRAARYVQDFNTRSNATHAPTDGTEKAVTLYYEDGGWTVGTGSGLVEFTVICENVPAQKYTVTYTDGVDGVEIFKDQVYADLTAGTATPKFDGTPTRVGYFFAGWNPAVAATVTGNATYTATWKVDSNNNGKPDDEEERYTVTYLDGANGKAFASQVYPGLLSGTATPKFNGTPVRSGYVFIGWSPVWSGTVTGNVTYTATWSTITGGLDKVPKTGDNGLALALSTLLLFSFYGAAACVISTRKRG